MRSLHRNTSPLKWDQELADSSCAWAEKLVKENHGNLMHCKERGENVGENLFVAMSSEMHDQNDIAEKAVKKWYVYMRFDGHFLRNFLINLITPENWVHPFAVIYLLTDVYPKTSRYF